MKKIILFAILYLVANNTNAQGINDQTSMGQFYTNQVFYSFENGEVANITNNDWNIAFSVLGQGAKGSSILLNEATSSLWQAPLDTTAWATFDSTGYASAWDQLLNSDTSWTNGAFNRFRGGASFFDLGWGSLDPSNNYWTLGDSLYLIKLGDGSFKKLWIKSLKTGVWNFTYADPNGANENSITITKTDYPNKNFVYVLLENGTIIDREPDNATWDIMWTKHTDYINPPGLYIGVTSVFNNIGVWTAKSEEVDLNAALNATTPQTAYTQNVINIGRTWKKRVSGQWVVNDSTAYFAWDRDSVNLYRIVFTGFDGMITGNSYFNILKLATADVTNNYSSINSIIYPNPVNTNLTIKLANNTNNGVFKLYNLNGQLVLSKKLFDTKTVINIENLSKGIYIYTLNDGNELKQEKLVIN